MSLILSVVTNHSFVFRDKDPVVTFVGIMKVSGTSLRTSHVSLANQRAMVFDIGSYPFVGACWLIFLCAIVTAPFVR